MQEKSRKRDGRAAGLAGEERGPLCAGNRLKPGTDGKEESLNITVFLGSSMGSDPEYETAARELGAWIGSAGHRLIYGGSDCGLMGVLAKAAIQAGGEVTAVEPKFFLHRVSQPDGLTKLIVTEDMRDRKKRLMDLSDVMIAFPGGCGTIEEITEAVTAVKLGLVEPGPAGKRRKKCIFYNLGGYYDPMRVMYDRMTEEKFFAEEDRAAVFFVPDLGALRKEIANS